MKFMKNETLIILVVLLLISISTTVWQKLKTQKIGVVDPQHIVSIEAQKLAKIYPNGNVPKEKLGSLANRLRKEVEDYASKNNLILFSKNAVIGGDLPDHTAALLEKLEQEVEP